MSVDYLLHESPVGYAIFKVEYQPDTIGNRLKEVQDSAQVIDLLIIVCRCWKLIVMLIQDLAKFGKMVKLISFAPFQ